MCTGIAVSMTGRSAGYSFDMTCHNENGPKDQTEYQGINNIFHIITQVPEVDLSDRPEGKQNRPQKAAI